MHDVLIDPALEPYIEEQCTHNEKLMQTTAAIEAIDTTSTEGVRWLRDAMAPGGLFGMQALDFPEERTIPGSGGPIPIRVMTPDHVEGVYLHFHGGGMTLGSAAGMDTRNWAIARACKVAVVSVDYRLAPEDPFPAGPDDAEAAARWLVDHAAHEFGSERLLIGGESAGAYLAVLTLLRLRDTGPSGLAFLGANLCYGPYDLAGTPSTRLLRGRVPYASESGDGANRRHYLPGRSDDEVRDPSVSPLYADLTNLPPVLLTVGTADWLLDDSLFLAVRLEAARSPVELAVYPEGPHGIDGAPTEMGARARQRINRFLCNCLADG